MRESCISIENRHQSGADQQGKRGFSLGQTGKALIPLSVCLFICCQLQVVQASPNIVVIMVDDLGMRAFDFLLEGGQLPNIDTHLVKQGTNFRESFVTNSGCCPSRVTFLRGQYSHNHAVYSNFSPDPLKPGIAWPGWFPKDGKPGRSESTVATWLQAAGYRTGYVGKYLNGYGGVAPDGLNPQTYIPPGWDDWNATVGLTTYHMYDYVINANGVLVPYGSDPSDYQTDVLAQISADFVQQEARTPGPFFLFVSPLAPHVEVFPPGSNLPAGTIIRPAPRHAYLMDDDPNNGEMPDFPQQPSFNEADMADKPSCPELVNEPNTNLVTVPICIGDSPSFNEASLIRIARMNKEVLTSMLAVDDLVGTLVTQLENSGVLDETVILFTSDNGLLHGEHRYIGKAYAYEESIRVPLLIRTPSGLTDVEVDQIALNNDLAPTIIDIANASAPYDMDGASLVPLLNSPSTANWTRKAFLVENWFITSRSTFGTATMFAWRRKTTGADFTYIATHADEVGPNVASDHELYNLPGDPYQMHSIRLSDQAYTSVDNFLLMLRVCKGEMCRLLESL